MEEARRLITRLQRPGLWGWKDPRTIFFIDLWMALLPTIRMIIPFRHPIELLASYMLRVPNWRLVREADQVFRSFVAYHSKILQMVEQRPGQCYVFYAQTGYQDLGRLQGSLEGFLDAKLDVPLADGVFHDDEFTDLGLGPAEHELFAKFFPAAAKCFDQVNQVAAIEFKPDGGQSSSRPEYSALSQLAEYMSPSADAADIVPAFLRIVAPRVPAYSRYVASNLDELIRKITWLEQHATTQEIEIEHLNEETKQLGAAVLMYREVVRRTQAAGFL